MSPARVLSFGSVPPEWGGANRGGVATFHATLVEALAPGCGLPAEIVGIVTGGRGALPFPVARRALRKGQTRPEFLRETIDELRPDAAILHHVATPWGQLLPEVAPDLPTVGVAHSWHSATLLADERERQDELGRIQAAMSSLSALVVGSAHALEEGGALGLCYPARTEVIPYPLHQRFCEAVDVDRARAGVVFAGGLIGRKNPVLLLELAARRPDLEVILAGEGPEETALRTRAAELALGDRVRFEPHRAPDEHGRWLRDLFATSEVLCVPSQSESFGLVYIEALSCGTPVVGFGPTLAEIEEAVGLPIGIGLGEPSADAVADAISRVRAAGWDRERLRAATLEAFAPGPVGQRYATLLAEVAGPRSDRARAERAP